MVRNGDELYFSPNYKFIDLKWDDKDNLIKAFRDRVEGFYLTPTKELNKSKKYAFATGVICVTTIDFLARIELGLSDQVGRRFENWLKSNISDFNVPNPNNRSQSLAYRFYDEFRNGLVHEGRIKNAGQFSYNFSKSAELVKVKDTVMIVNPGTLLEVINTSFDRYMDEVENKEFVFQAFRCALIRDFQIDIKYVNRNK